MNTINFLFDHNIIAIGEFAHGIRESWEFRFQLLKHAMKTTDKKIVIFNEMAIWQAENIMNNTIWSFEKNTSITYKGIKKETPHMRDGFVNGAYWHYFGHLQTSDIFLKIVKYIRANRDRVQLFGIDNDNIDRDYDMAKIIIKKHKPCGINFLWAHNHHISDGKMSQDNMRWIKNKTHKWWCGYYLKHTFGKDYCIIQSQAYEGRIRFDGYCSGTDCEHRTWQLQYIYSNFKIPANKKYISKEYDWQLLDKKQFNEAVVSFSNSYYRGKKYGMQSADNYRGWDYMLFWNKVKAF